MARIGSITFLLVTLGLVTYWVSADLTIWPFIKTPMGWVGLIMSIGGLILGIFGQDGVPQEKNAAHPRTDWQGIGLTSLTIGLIILAAWLGFWLRYR